MISALLRLPLCGAVTGAALAGYLAAGGRSLLQEAWLAAGVLLAAGGATVLNQWQERGSDALMDRTRLRPLACGRLQPGTGLALGACLATTGTLLLSALDRHSGLLTLGVLALYHLLYTPLKRRSILALLPGALCGALPPAIGWLAGGGTWRDPRLLTMTALLLLWQIPHSWQILLRRRGDLQRAGMFPELHHLPRRRLQQLVFVWVAALSTATLAVPVLLTPAPPALRWLSSGLAVWPLAALLFPPGDRAQAPAAGWRHGSGVAFLGTLLGLLLLY